MHDCGVVGAVKIKSKVGKTCRRVLVCEIHRNMARVHKPRYAARRINIARVNTEIIGCRLNDVLDQWDNFPLFRGPAFHRFFLIMSRGSSVMRTARTPSAAPLILSVDTIISSPPSASPYPSLSQ